MEAVGASAQSGPQPGVLGMLRITAESREAPRPAGEMGVSSSAECPGGREQAVPLPSIKAHLH